jgi:hypothetical protein
LKVGLEQGVFRLKLSSRGFEPIAFLRQRILHALHRCEVFIYSADPDDLSAGIQKRQFRRVVPGDSAIGVNKPFDFSHERFFRFHGSSARLPQPLSLSPPTKGQSPSSR